MFKAIILCALYNLSDDQVEYQMRDRLSFVRFLGLTLEDKVPDAKTVWLYREQLSQVGGRIASSDRLVRGFRLEKPGLPGDYGWDHRCFDCRGSHSTRSS